MTNFIANTQLFWLFYPLVFMFTESQAIIAGSHTIRSTINVAIPMIGCILGIIIFCNNMMNSSQYFSDIINAAGIPTSLQYITSLYLATLFSGSISAAISKICTKTFCWLHFGDPDFYLTNKRANQLETIFKHQGYVVNVRTIRSVINFCVHNFRKPATSQFGSNVYDWKRVIEALIYDADLEVFLEQQELLQSKLIKTTLKCKALAKYGSMIDLEKALHWNFKNQTKLNVELPALTQNTDEQQPLLQQMSAILPDNIPPRTNTDELTELPYDIREKMLVVKILNHFKGYKNAEQQYTHEHRELLYHCSTYFKWQELHLHESIFPLCLLPSATESIDSSITPQSNGSSSSDRQSYDNAASTRNVPTLHM